jgi:hypothetical protein
MKQEKKSRVPKGAYTNLIRNLISANIKNILTHVPLPSLLSRLS